MVPSVLLLPDARPNPEDFSTGAVDKDAKSSA
jgi:hypothetical protein